jgi:glucose/arabinose dehydrogenase
VVFDRETGLIAREIKSDAFRGVVGVCITHDGLLLVSDDIRHTIYVFA